MMALISLALGVAAQSGAETPWAKAAQDDPYTKCVFAESEHLEPAEPGPYARYSFATLMAARKGCAEVKEAWRQALHRAYLATPEERRPHRFDDSTPEDDLILARESSIMAHRKPF